MLTTRCATGFNYDDHLYAGSLEKYESRGFRLRGYEGLNALQARVRLMLELASRTPHLQAGCSTRHNDVTRGNAARV